MLLWGLAVFRADSTKSAVCTDHMRGAFRPPEPAISNQQPGTGKRSPDIRIPATKCKNAGKRKHSAGNEKLKEKLRQRTLKVSRLRAEAQEPKA